MSSAIATTYWRLAGLSYMQYVTRATSTLRSALKEPARTKAKANTEFAYNKSFFEAGVQSAKKRVTDLGAAGAPKP